MAHPVYAAVFRGVASRTPTSIAGFPIGASRRPPPTKCLKSKMIPRQPLRVFEAAGCYTVLVESALLTYYARQVQTHLPGIDHFRFIPLKAPVPYPSGLSFPAPAPPSARSYAPSTAWERGSSAAWDYISPGWRWCHRTSAIVPDSPPPERRPWEIQCAPPAGWPTCPQRRAAPRGGCCRR